MTDSTRGEAEGYIVGRGYDWLFFLAPPLASLGVAPALAFAGAGQDRFWLDGRRHTWLDLTIAALIHAHLAAVLFRSHGNREVFRRHRWRFTVVPAIVFVSMLLSPAFLLIASVVATFWDVYHSALQTFGLARIYDRKHGNSAIVGRRLDWALNQLLYVGPLVAGASMAAHAEQLSKLDELGWGAFSQVPALMVRGQPSILALVIVLGIGFIGYYLWAYRGLRRNGYRVSRQKTWLLASTALCSLIAWGFNPWGYAFIIMNLFHAIQYLGLVWWTDARHIGAALRPGESSGGALMAAAFVILLALYGVWAALVPQSQRVGFAFVQLIALMHFWYDGFIWSVSRDHVG